MADRKRHVLHTLAQDGDVKLLQQALKAASPNVPDADGMLPLHYASWYGHPLCCQALLSSNAEVDAFDHDGASALHAASYNGQLACVVLLVENGASARVSDNENQTPKDAAAKERHVDIVNYLRVVEEDQKREDALARAREEFTRTQESAKVFKPEVVKATKEAKKKIEITLKDAKRIKKETISALKRERGKKSRRSSLATSAAAAPGTPGPESFSKLAMSGADGATPGYTDASKKGISKSKRLTSGGSATGTPESNRGSERPLPDVPQTSVSPEVATEMVLAEFEADGEGSDGLIAFLKSIDLNEFARLLAKHKMTLEKLARASQEDLTKLGLPAGARKKIYSTLHPI